MTREVPAPVDEGVEQPHVSTGEVLALLGNRRARCLRILDQVVVEHGTADEQAVVFAVERQLRDQLVRARYAALRVVEVAVVDVRRTPGPAVGGRDQSRIACFLAPGLA